MEVNYPAGVLHGRHKVFVAALRCLFSFSLCENSSTSNLVSRLFSADSYRLMTFVNVCENETAAR